MTATAYTPCVYRVYDQTSALLYIGSTNCLRNRICYHSKYSPWWSPSVEFIAEPCDSLTAARHAEAVAISTEHPRWNIEGRSRNHPDGHADTQEDVAAKGFPWRVTKHFNPNLPHRVVRRGYRLEATA